MPPRTAAAPAGAAPEEREDGAALGFPLTALPTPLQHRVFASLPVDARARAAAVCRDWRDALREPSLWRVLDLSPSSGVTCAVTDEALAGAAAKAAGAGLTALDVSQRRRLNNGPLRQVVAANAATLRLLRVANTPHDATELIGNPTTEALTQLAVVAPQLRQLHASARVSQPEAAQLLRGEAPFEALAPVLRLHALVVLGHINGDVRELTAALAAPPSEPRAASLTSLSLIMASLHEPAALDAVVDVALARRLRALTLGHANLSPLAAPSLVRLLGGGALTRLRIVNRAVVLLDAEAGALLAGALRANSTLTDLSLDAADLWAHPAAALALLGALTGHASVRTLALPRNSLPGEAPAAPAARAALAALVAADAPALTALDVSRSALSADDAALLFGALARNAHLRSLRCAGHAFRDAFVRDVALPALRANARLTHLVLEDRSDGESESEEEEEEEEEEVAPAEWDDDYADDHVSSADEEEEEVEEDAWAGRRAPARDEAPWAAVRREMARRRRAAAAEEGL
jgi:hypothetical protein